MKNLTGTWNGHIDAEDYHCLMAISKGDRENMGTETEDCHSENFYVKFSQTVL
jgi:hypothetical protein